MNKKQTQFVAVGVIAVLVMVGIAYFFGIKPQMENRSMFKTATDAAVASTATLDAQVVDLSNKEAGLPTAQSEYQSLAKQFPTSLGLRDWVGMVLQTADATNVVLSDISPTLPTIADPAAVAGAPVVPVNPAAAPVAGDLAVSTVSLSAAGSADDLRAFLAALGQMERPLLIDSADLNITEEPTITITGKTFLIKELLSPEEQAALTAVAPTS